MMDTFHTTCTVRMVMDPRMKMCMRALRPEANPREDVHDHQVASHRLAEMDGPTQNQWYTFLSSFILF